MAWLDRRQADIARELGWERGRISKIYNSRQPYARGDVVELAQWLEIEPFELLMPPTEAIGLRNLRRAAAQIVAEDEPPPFKGARQAVTPHRPSAKPKAKRA